MNESIEYIFDTLTTLSPTLEMPFDDVVKRRYPTYLPSDKGNKVAVISRGKSLLMTADSETRRILSMPVMIALFYPDNNTVDEDVGYDEVHADIQTMILALDKSAPNGFIIDVTDVSIDVIPSQVSNNVGVIQFNITFVTQFTMGG
jgi:hypothetical protein